MSKVFQLFCARSVRLSVPKRRLLSSASSIVEQQSNQPVVKRAPISLHGFLISNRCREISEYIKSMADSMPSDSPELRALDELLAQQVHREQMTAARDAITRQEKLSSLSSEYHDLLEKVAHALNIVSTFACRQRQPHLPPFFVLAECFSLLFRIDSTDPRVFALVEYSTNHFQKLNHWLYDTFPKGGTSSGAWETEEIAPSASILNSRIIPSLQHFSDSSQPHIRSLMWQLGNTAAWLAGCPDVAYLDANGLHGRMRSSGLLGYTGSGDIDFMTLHDFTDSLFGLQGMQSSAPEAQRLIQILYISACHISSNHSYGSNGDAIATSDVGGSSNARLRLSFRREAMTIVGDALIGLQGSFSSPRHSHSGPSSSDGGISGLAYDPQRLAGGLFSLGPVWASMLHVVLSAVGHSVCRQPVGIDSSKSSESSCCDSDSRVVADIAAARGLYAAVEAATAQDPNLPQEAGAFDLEVLLNSEPIFALGNAVLGLIDKQEEHEGKAFAALSGLLLRLGELAIVSYYNDLRLSISEKHSRNSRDSYRSNSRDIEVVSRQAQQTAQAVVYLCQTVALASRRSAGLSPDSQEVARRAFRSAKTALFAIQKEGLLHTENEQRKNQVGRNTRAALSSSGFQVDSLSEKRVLNSLLRILRQWRRGIFPLILKSTVAFNAEDPALKSLLTSFSVSTDELIDGMSTDIVLRGMVPSAALVAAQVVTVNVEVDGLHHKLARKLRFQKLRDAHLQRSGVYIVRLTSEEFTALDDISMDSYVENAFLVAVTSNVLVKKL